MIFHSISALAPKKLEELKENATKISRHSRIVIAATENTFMPMIQLAILFPMFIQLNYDGIVSDLNGKLTPFEFLETISSNWTIFLTISSGVASIVSMAGSRTSIYFTGKGKETQKSLKNRAVIFGIVTLQILAKVVACQVFAFGVMGSYFWDYFSA